jgi:hypothetical protein
VSESVKTAAKAIATAAKHVFMVVLLVGTGRIVPAGSMLPRHPADATNVPILEIRP